MSETLLIDPTGAWSPVTRKPTLLAIGGLMAYSKTLTRFGLILNVAWELDKARMGPKTACGMPVLFARLDDTEDAHIIKRQTPEVLRSVALVREARAAGKDVLVTCAQGRNRSGLVIAEYLISSGLKADAVIKTIQERRANALTNRAFVAWLKRRR